MTIPLVDLKRQYQYYRSLFDKTLLETAGSCDFILGGALRQFEDNFSAYLGVKHVIGVGSGTDALTLILKAIGCSPDDIVLTQDNTFVATALAIVHAGGRMALTDIDDRTYAMDVESYTGDPPKVVIPVHLYGYPLDVETIRSQFGPTPIIVEDACQAHGSSLNGKKCGSLGLAAAFSFYPSKNLGAFGDGGAVSTDDDGLAEALRSFRNWGSKAKYRHDGDGWNSRLDTIQAAVLDAKLTYLDGWNARRNALADQYRKNLAGIDEIILPPAPPPGHFQNYHLFVIRFRHTDRDQVLHRLQTKGIFAGIHYPVPIHRQTVFSSHGVAQQSFPVASAVAGQILSLPLFPELTDDEVAAVCEALIDILKTPGAI